MTDWKLFVKLILSILAPHQGSTDDPKDHDFVNSMIMSRSPEKRNTQSDEQPIAPTALAPLKPSEKQAVTTQAYEDVMDVVNFLFCPESGVFILELNGSFGRVQTHHFPLIGRMKSTQHAVTSAGYAVNPTRTT